MANWLDKYEQGGMVLKKKTKDNYGKKANPNDVKVSAGPGFEGDGYAAHNWKSPAWGGQFQMGGSLPGAVGFTYARTAGSAPANGKYTKKTLASAQEGKKMPKAYWTSNDDREAYRKNLKSAAEAALTNNASDEDLLISTSYHDMNTGNNCINGVCGLNRKAGLSYNAPTDNDRFLSGEKFAQAVAKGDEDYYQVSGNFQPGDHLQYRNKKGSSSHNKIIYDVQADDKGEKMYKVIDNAGSKDMRSRDYTEAELKELVEKGGGGYDKVNIYRPGYNLDKPLLDKEREAKTSPEARAALAERKNIQEWDASHNPGFDYSIRPESEYYNKQPEGMKKFIDFANDDAKVTELAKKLGVGKDIIHDQLLNTFGELGQENKWEDPWFGGDLSKGISPIPIPFESTIEKVLSAVGGGKGWSVGPGQIKFNTLDPELRKQFGINRPKDLHDMDKVIPLMTAINVKNKKWMENQGDDLSTKLVGNPGTSADEIKYGVDRWVPYAYQGLPNDPIAAVRKRAEANANEYRMSKKDREDYISNYINKNVDPEKLKTFDEGSYANSVYNLIDKNLSRTMPAQNYEQYNELMPVTVKSKKKMQNGGEMAFYQNGLDFTPKSISKNGSVIKDDRGQWAYPGEVTEIGSNDITMQGVDYPVLGVSDTGDTKMMQPGQDYKFDGEKVTEYPMMQEGGWLDKYQDGGNINKKLKKEAEEFLARQIANRTTMSQYTPKTGEAERLEKEKAQRREENAKPLSRLASNPNAEAFGRNIPDAALFALDVMTLGEGTLALKGLAKPALEAAGKYLTEKTALKNAYKLNPYAFKPTEGMMYRGIGEGGMKDALGSGVFRAKQDVQPIMKGNFDMSKQFSKPYFSPSFETADRYGNGFIAEVPKDATTWGNRYSNRNTWSQIAREDIPTEKGKILKKDWLKGYKQVKQPTSTQRVTRGPVNYWEEPGFAKRNPNFNPEAYANSPVGNTSASRDIPEGMTPYLTMDDVTPNVKPSWKSQELPGLHLSATMEGGPISKIIEPKTGLINVDQALTIIGKESGGASKVDMIKQSLGKDIPKKMDYNDFRKTVQDQLIPLDREVVNTFRSAYNIDRLGYTKASADGKDIILNRINNTRAEILKFETKGTPEGWEDYFKRMKENLETDLKDYSNLPLENQTIRLSNKSKFGRGADTHGNPEETLGHIHFLRDAESPDVLTMTQLQSDAFQSTNRTMPKSLEEANAKLNKLKDYANYNPSVRTDAELSLEEASVKNFSQKSLLDKNHQERYLQELVDYAGKRGDINKIRVPTSETAAKVQGYIETSSTGDNAPGFGKLQEEISVAVRQGDQQKVNDLMKVHDEMLKTPYKTYSSDQKTILKKYSEQPKVIKKVFGVEPKTVKDSKGNSWYEFDIPAKFKGGKGEIKAFKDGGWLNKYK